MAKFLKHVGKHGDRKVAVIFRQIPGEEHMCLVVYTETLNQNMHDPLMACIESPQGQAAENLADALNRAYTLDGQIILQVLHREGMMKKIQTAGVMMTPAPNSKIKLSELNSLLNEMAQGDAAVKRLAEIDASRGLQDPKDVAKRKRGESTVNLPPKEDQTSKAYGLLGNNDLANNLRNQAAKMAAEAKGLIAESERLLKEANQMDGIPAKSETKTRAKKQSAVTVEAAPVKKGRPKKVTVAS